LSGKCGCRGSVVAAGRRPPDQSAAALEVVVEEDEFPESVDLAGDDESDLDSDDDPDELDAAVFSFLIPEEFDP